MLFPEMLFSSGRSVLHNFPGLPDAPALPPSACLALPLIDNMGLLRHLHEPWLVWLSGLSAGLPLKGRWFNSLSGHTPGLWAGPQLGACKRHLMEVSLAHWFLSLLVFSLPSPLSKSK